MGNVCDPFNVNFQPCAAPIPGGYLKDCGETFTEVRGYGWSAVVDSRDRNVASDQRLDTFVFTTPQRTWEAVLPDADYLVTVSVGDATVAQGPHRIEVEGQVLVNNVSTLAGQFFTASGTVRLRDGRLTLKMGGTTGVTALNFITVVDQTIQPATLLSVDFQPSGAVLPLGWSADIGDTFLSSRGYGWSAAVPTRERNQSPYQILDTFAFTQPERTWEAAVPNGFYDVALSVGDPVQSAGAPAGDRRGPEGRGFDHDPGGPEPGGLPPGPRHRRPADRPGRRGPNRCHRAPVPGHFHRPP